jgi:hypothetical protein
VAIVVLLLLRLSSGEHNFEFEGLQHRIDSGFASVANGKLAGSSIFQTSNSMQFSPNKRYYRKCHGSGCVYGLGLLDPSKSENELQARVARISMDWDVDVRMGNNWLLLLGMQVPKGIALTVHAH